MMQTFTYTKRVNPALLSDELIAAVPALPGVTSGARGQPITEFSVSVVGTNVTVTVPDNVRQQDIDKVVNNHVYSDSPSRAPVSLDLSGDSREHAIELESEIHRAKNLNDLKTALIQYARRMQNQ